MPRGIYNHRETKTPIYTIERNRKVGEASKGNKYRLGQNPTEETKEKMKKSHTGRHQSEMAKRKIAEYHKGLKLSETTKKKMSESHKKFTGEKNPAWKGGITPINALIRSSLVFDLWREAVFTRDNWTCQKYHIKGGKLCAHHIQNFAEYPELRFAIDNGITLSKKAHKEFHHKYGMRNNTKEQLEQFLIN